MNKKLITLLAFLVVPLSGVCIDIYVPSLPAVSRFFAVPESLAQLTVSAYLAGLALTQLLAGGVTDSFGRVRPLLMAMSVFVVATFLIPHSWTIYQLIFLRLVQGSALALAVVPTRSIIADLYQGPALQKMMTYMTMSWSLGPLVAPAIGGYIQQYLGWKAIFYFLGFYSVGICILAKAVLVETSVHRHPFSLSSLLQRYTRMLTHSEFLNCVVSGGLLISIIALFAVVGPFYFQNILHYSALEFSRISLLMGLGWFLGSMMNRVLLQVDLKTKANGGLGMMLVSSVTMVLSGYLLIPLFFLFFGAGILYPSFFMRSITLFPQATGSANALYNSAAFFVAGVCSGLGTYIKVGSVLPFALVLAAVVLSCILLNSFGGLRRQGA